MSPSRSVMAVCALMTMVFSGCGGSGPKLYPASGTITYEGKPVENATVMFTPQAGTPSMGTTDAAGKYMIQTRGKPGVPAGTYTVTVTKQISSTGAEGTSGSTAMPTGDAPPSEEEMRKMMEGTGSMMRAAADSAGKAQEKDAFPRKYSLPDASGLSAIVTADASKNVFDFQLMPE